MKKQGGLKAGLQEQTKRVSLVVLLAIVCFCVLLVAILLAVGVVFLLIRLKVFEGVPQDIRMSNIVLVLVLTSTVMGWAMVLLLGKLPLNPIHKLIEGLNSLAAGNFKTRVSYKSVLKRFQTFHEIEESFNKLAKELESTEMLRSDFINNFSHEFKTPIVSIAGFAEILESTELTDEERAQYIAAIKEESRRLASMATNILELTKVENQSILTDVLRFNVSEQLRSALVLLEGKWSKKKVELDFDFDEYDIVGNEEFLKQVWINLLDNAIKFVDEGGVIGAKIIPSEGQLRIDISNTGTTIPAEKQKYVFNKFYQADESHSTKGNGIGLAIVKGIVELHDGSVSVKSEDGVTTFSVYLPF